MRDSWKLWVSKIQPVFWWWFWIVVGIVLRLRQYAANRSFWHDEASLALNLVERSFGGLTRPLSYEQGAPIAFLFIEKTIMLILGNRDFILRLFPLVSGIIALYLLYRIAKDQFGISGMFALAMVSVDSILVYYASELKQYTSDMMFALLMIFLSLPRMERPVRGRDFLLLGGVGAFSIWASHPAAFVLAGIGLVMAFDRLWRKDYTSLAWLVGVGLVWFAALGAEYFLSLRYLAADPYLQFYWRKAFLPLPPWGNVDWYYKTYYSFLLMSLGRTDLILSLLFLGLIFIGSISLLVRKWKLALVLILPFFMVALASYLQKYPLKDRFMLFLIPLAMLLITEGLWRMYALAARWNRTMALFLPALAALTFFGYAMLTTWPAFLRPVLQEEIKPIMKYVMDHRTPADEVYVYHGATSAFTYYAPFYGFNAGQVVAAKDEPNPKIALENFYEDMKSLDGDQRVWVIFSHVTDCGGCKEAPETFYVQYLDRLGKQMDHFAAIGADVYLYNFSP